MGWLRSTPFLLLAAAGCTGQNIEGAWRGTFPLESAHQCELRLQSNHMATVQCDRSAIVGGGHYVWDGQTLEISLTALTYGGKRVQSPPTFAFKVQGAGNTVRAAQRGTVYEWKRTLK